MSPAPPCFGVSPAHGPRGGGPQETSGEVVHAGQGASLPGSRSLRERIAGQSAMSDVVLAQSAVPPRGRVARILGLSPLSAQSRMSYNGALGELLVGDVLENLGGNWDILHDLPLALSGALLDHLVIGPAGVFAVHVSNPTDNDFILVSDRLPVGHEAYDHLSAARAQAAAAAALLSAASPSPVIVRALLVVVEKRFLGARVAADAVVIPLNDLERFVTGAARTLTGAEVARISDLADLATTWPDAPAPRLDVQSLHRQLAVVRAEVRAALLHRVLWGTLGIALLYLAVWILVARAVSVIISG